MGAIVIFFILFFIIFVSYLNIQIKEEDLIKKIKEKNPGIDIDKLKKEVAVKYMKIIRAYNTADLKTLVQLETNSLYEKHKIEIENGLKKSPSSIYKYNHAEITGFSFDNNMQKIIMKLSVLADNEDLIQDNTAGNLLVTIEIVCTNKQNVTKNEVCPNCGAKVDINIQGQCTYCKSLLINTNHSWLINTIKYY